MIRQYTLTQGRFRLKIRQFIHTEKGLEKLAVTERIVCDIKPLTIEWLRNYK